MGVRSLVAILALTIALIAVLGAQPKWAVFLPGLLEGTRITIMVALAGSALAVVAGLAAGLGRLYAPAPIRFTSLKPGTASEPG